MKTKLKVNLRWMLPKMDLDSVLAIERNVFQFSWTREDFFSALQERTVTGFVCEEKDQVHGYTIIDLESNKVAILNFAIASEHWRKRIGSQIMDKLKTRGRPIYCDVRETNLPFQMFLKSQGFTCVRVIEEEYADTDEDAYRFVWEGE